jgi:hypothetical protein
MFYKMVFKVPELGPAHNAILLLPIEKGHPEDPIIAELAMVVRLRKTELWNTRQPRLSIDSTTNS